MKARVLRYKLPGVGEQTVQMPQGARVLHVGAQRYDERGYMIEPLANAPTLWALVPDGVDELPTFDRHFVIVETGEFFEGAGDCEFVGAAIFDDGRYVMHVFERALVYPVPPPNAAGRPQASRPSPTVSGP